MNLTLVGLGVVGTSLGLALKATSPEIAVTGHDPEAHLVARARKLGAIDKSHWNLLSACENADVVLFDLPLTEIEKTLTALRGELRQDTLLIDTAPLKRPVLAWAERILPEIVQFVGAHIVSPRQPLGEAEPSAEWLRGATFYVVPSARAAPWALEATSRLATLVGAIPQYIDAVEHDGLVAPTMQLPLLSALALADLVSSSPGWPDRAKCVGGELLAQCALLGYTPAAPESLLANADSVLSWLDAYAQRLSALRGVIAAQDGEALRAAVTRAAQACARWASPGGPAAAETTKGEDVTGLRGLFLGGVGRRRPSQDQNTDPRK